MKKYIISIITIIIVLTIGVSYAWFSGIITGEEKKFTISAKELKIIFTDKEEIEGNDIEPGWEDSKRFSVENKSNGTFNYNISIDELVNTFVVPEGLQYKITSSNGYNMEEFVDVPKSEIEEDKVIAYDIDIEKDEIQEYTITFRYYDNKDVDQSEDMGKIFSGRLSIEEGTVNPNIKYKVTLNGNDFSVDNNIKETIKNGSVEFNVIPNEGYTLGNVVSCDNEAIGVIEKVMEHAL